MDAEARTALELPAILDRVAAAAATEIELAAAEARRSKAQLVRLILEDWAAGRRERGERAGGVDAR